MQLRDVRPHVVGRELSATPVLASWRLDDACLRNAATSRACIARVRAVQPALLNRIALSRAAIAEGRALLARPVLQAVSRPAWREAG
jgi:hypothetical protein